MWRSFGGLTDTGDAEQKAEVPIKGTRQSHAPRINLGERAKQEPFTRQREEIVLQTGAESARFALARLGTHKTRLRMASSRMDRSISEAS
jgi:hypothetical protein